MNYAETLMKNISRTKRSNEQNDFVPTIDTSGNGYLELTQDELDQVEIKQKTISKKIANYFMSCINENWYKNFKNKDLVSILENNDINDLIWEIIYKTCYYGSVFILGVKLNSFMRIFIVPRDRSVFFTYTGNKVLTYVSLFEITQGSIALPMLFFGDVKNNQFNSVKLQSADILSLGAYLANKKRGNFNDFVVNLIKNKNSTTINEYGLPIVWNYFDSTHENIFVESKRYILNQVRSEKQIWDDGDFSGNKLFIRENWNRSQNTTKLNWFTKMFRKPVVSLKDDDFNMNARTGLGKYQPQSGVSQIQELLMRNKWAKNQAYKTSNYFVNSNTKGTAQQHTLEVALDNIDSYLFQKRINETLVRNLTFFFQTIIPNFNEKIDFGYKNFVFDLISQINTASAPQQNNNSNNFNKEEDNGSK